ncbi:MAG: ABC transporter substrate-binding protein [Planctomycetes bacterium]|nr:ABC transporter substrate-binding protein [Planctomycetota bacterium]
MHALISRRPVLSFVRTLALGAGLGLAALTGCDSGTSPSNANAGKAAPSGTTTSAAAAPAAAGDIVIGHYGSLTGSKATFGLSTDNGIKLAVEEVNKAGGLEIGGQKHKVVLKSEDTEGKQEKAGTVVTKLITADKVVAVLGEVASGITLAGAPIAQQFGVPMITPSSTNPQCTAVGDMIFRVCFIDPFQGYACAKFAAQDLKVKKAAILFDQAAPYSVGLKDEFESNFKKMGGEIVAIEAYTEGEANFNPLLTKIRERGAELLFIPGYYTDVANIALQARKLGMKMPLLGGDGWDSSDLAKNGGAAIEGSFYSNHYASDQPTPEIQNFVTKYQAAFGETPDGLAALGYDAARLLFDSMQRARSSDGSKVRDAIATTKDFKGVTGTISINEKRDAVKPAVIVEMKGGKPVFRARVEP